MIGKLKQRIDRQYADSDIIIQKKAGILFYLDIFIFALMLLLSTTPFFIRSGGSHPYSLLFGTVTLMTAGLGSLIILASGRFSAASAFLVILVALAGGLGLTGKYLMAPHTGFAIIFFYQSAVVFAALISSLAVTTLVAFLMASYSSVFYLLVRRRYDGVIAEMMKNQFLESLFALVLTYFLTGLVIRMMSGVVDRMREEAAGSEKRYGVIRSLFEAIGGASDRLNASSGEMSDAAARLSDDAQEQAASVEEMSSSIEELSANFFQIEKNSVDSFSALMDDLGYMESMSSLIMRVRSETGRVSESFNEINGLIGDAGPVMDASRESTASMMESSSRVSDIVSIIDDFFGKINLLSLNASIEAARAGEYGRGFAVVAEEISKLSDRSAGSLREISTLIEQNRGEVEKGNRGNEVIAEMMERIIGKLRTLEGGMDALFALIDEQNSLKSDIERNTGSLRERFEEIRKALAEQKKALEQIDGAISGINDITQSNAANAEQLAASTRMIRSMAEELHSRTAE
jgi:methyl-accepting chemotaxis protein